MGWRRRWAACSLFHNGGHTASADKMGVRVVILLTCIASWSILGCAVKGADGSKRGEAVSESSTPRTFQYVQLNITSLEDGNQARILSNEGSVLIRIKDKWAPAAAERFVHLCREKYYDVRAFDASCYRD